MKLEGEAVIDRPVEQVFPFVADFSRVSDWAEPVAEREVLTEGPVGVGTQVRAVDQLPGRRIEFIEEVTVWEPNEIVTVRMGEPWNGDFTITFDGMGESTRLTAMMDVKPSGLMGFATTVFGWRMRQLFQQDLNRLKAMMESAG